MKEKLVNKFQDDFELVAEHFQLRERNEYDQALAAARDDIAGAKACYSAIASSLRIEGKAAGLNERIQARIEAEKRAAA